MRIIPVTIVALVSISIAMPAVAAIQYGDNQSYSAPFAASTTDQVGKLVSGTGVDLNDLNSSSSISAGLGILSSIGNFFSNINTWLKDKAGIDLFAILSAIGHWFVIFLEWLIRGLKVFLRID